MIVLLRASVLLGRSIRRRFPAYCTSSSSSSSLYHKLNVQVGASLQLNMAQVDADVDVHTGDNMEQIEVKSFWKNSGSVPAAFNPITQQNNRISVDLQTNEAKHSLLNLEAVVPGRWCNLFFRGGKGHVMIQNMKEANVTVVTDGGNVTLGEVRGNEALIESNGGLVKAALIAAALVVKTGGGLLSLDKAIGTTLQLDSNGGDVRIGSAYGQDVDITSGGGCIMIKHLQAQQIAHVSSNGGHVRIDGLDGNAVISTSGGNLHLQLLENAKEVQINAGAGEVTLYLPTVDHMKVEHVVDGESHAENASSPSGRRLLAGAEEDLARCRVSISGSGKVTTMKRSWLEAVMQSCSVSKAV